jgi:hypothetical protein
MLASLLFAALTLAPTPPTDWQTPFEKDPAHNTTATYHECIGYYQKLAAAYPQQMQLHEAGPTDAGQPLHEVVLSGSGQFMPARTTPGTKPVVFIQNGIHPGEPEGIDASMMLARDLLQKPGFKQLLQDLTIVIVPVYNVDGMLNRNSTTRVNQNGPAEYGFRGNARNLDLNRDFIKQDSRNARSFAALFQKWHPDIFVDTHTSNGADYQYTITLIASQHNKLAPPLDAYLQKQLLPALYAGMDQKKWPMTPYVDFEGETPESGLRGFSDSPRYSTGYAALFNTIAFMPETHMLKAFEPRVRVTYEFLLTMLETVREQRTPLLTARADAARHLAAQTRFPLAWALDETQTETLRFRGFEARHKASEVSGQPRLYYDRAAPYTRLVKYYNTYRPSLTVEAPTGYVIPAAWGEVIDNLRRNGVVLRPLAITSVPPGEQYYISDYKTTTQPYEGHYLHSKVQVEPGAYRGPALNPGDLVAVLAEQGAARRYLVETLEPQATDSFFAWGAFDGILQQKEHFSDYVFEDVAAATLAKDPALRQKLEEKKKADPAFAKDGAAQLEWVYQNGPFGNNKYRQYPIMRYQTAPLPDRQK